MNERQILCAHAQALLSVEEFTMHRQSTVVTYVYWFC